jgi:hypothetical protein
MAGRVGKLIKFVLLGILFVIIVAAIVFKFRGEQIITAAAETAGTRALNVKVDIDNIGIKFLSGSGTINGLTIANPAGFNNPHLMQMENGQIKVNTKTLFDDTVIIEKIHLDNLHVTFEQKGMSSNIKVITDNLKKDDPQDDDPQEGEGKKVVVSDLKIANSKLSIKLLPIPGRSDTVTVSLPEINMKDVGKGEKMSFEEIVELIFVKISEAIAKAGSDVIPEELLGPLNQSLKEAVDVIGGAGEQFFNIGEGIFEGGTDAGESIREGASKTLEDIGGLFKKKEKPQEPAENE